MRIHENRNNKLTLIVLVGNIGLGKTTFAKSLVETGYVISSLDAISDSLMGGISGVLHGADYARMCRTIYENTVYEAFAAGISIIADGLNIRIKERAYLCQIAKSFGARTMAIDFGPGTVDGLNRRASASDTFDYQGFDFMFQDYRNKYQKPTKDEGFNMIINKGAIDA